MNECPGHTDLATVASSFLTLCCALRCTLGAPGPDVASAVGVYDAYCESNGSMSRRTGRRWPRRPSGRPLMALRISRRSHRPKILAGPKLTGLGPRRRRSGRRRRRVSTRQRLVLPKPSPISTSALIGIAVVLALTTIRCHDYPSTLSAISLGAFARPTITDASARRRSEKAIPAIHTHDNSIYILDRTYRQAELLELHRFMLARIALGGN